MAHASLDLISSKVYNDPCKLCMGKTRESRLLDFGRLQTDAGATSVLRSTRVTLAIEDFGAPKPFGKCRMYKDATLAHVSTPQSVQLDPLVSLHIRSILLPFLVCLSLLDHHSHSLQSCRLRCNFNIDTYHEVSSGCTPRSTGWPFPV
jgi:hypothetical protein